MAKWHPLMYSDQDTQHNPIMDFLKESFSSCITGNTTEDQNTANNNSNSTTSS